MNTPGSNVQYGGMVASWMGGYLGGGRWSGSATATFLAGGFRSQREANHFAIRQTAGSIKVMGPSLAHASEGGHPQWSVFEHPKGVGGPAGAGAGGVGGASAGAAAATSAYQPTVSGSHMGLSTGPVEQGDQAPQRSGQFLGLNTVSPETSMSPGETPFCLNIDSAQEYGSIAFRRGSAKLLFDRDTVEYSSSPLGASYNGLSLAQLHPEDFLGDGGGGMLLVFQDNANFVIGGSANTRAMAVQQKVLQRRQKSLARVAGPTLTLASAASGQLSATIVGPRGGTTEQAYGEVVAATIRYSTVGFPLDVDGDDDRSKDANGDIDKVAVTSGFVNGANRAAWDGASQAWVATGLTPGTVYYVTAWMHSREGTSKPTFATITVSV